MISGHLTHWYDFADQGHDLGFLTDEEYAEVTNHLDAIMEIYNRVHDRET